MSTKNSSNSVKANRSIWKKNLPSSSKQKRYPSIPFVENLFNLTRMPTNCQILGNFNFLFQSEKRRQDRVSNMVKNIELLWNETLDFPILSRALIRKKLNHLIDLNDKNRKNPSNEFPKVLSKLFDVTNLKGEWKSSEDKELYQKQIKSGGKVGYSTVKQAPLKSMHPRKRTEVPSRSQHSSFHSKIGFDALSESDSECPPESPTTPLSPSSSSPENKPKYKRADTATASKLVRKSNISTHKAHDVLAIISEQGYDVPVPSQSEVLETEENLLKYFGYELRDICLYPLQQALECNNQKLVSLALNGFQRFLRDNQFYSEVNSTESQWLSNQVLDSLQSFQSLSENNQIEVLNIILAMCCIKNVVINNQAVVRILDFSAISYRKGGQVMKSASQAAAVQSITTLIQSIVQKLKDTNSEFDEIILYSKHFYELVSVLAYLIGKLNHINKVPKNDQSTSIFFLNCLSSLTEKLCQVVKIKPNHVCNKEHEIEKESSNNFIDFIWQQLCPSLISYLGIPQAGTQHQTSKTQVQVFKGLQNIKFSQSSCQEFKIVYKIACNLVSCFGPLEEIRPVLDSLFYKIFIYMPPLQRIDAFKQQLLIFKSCEQLVKFAGPILSYEKNNILQCDLNLLRLVLDSFMECSNYCNNTQMLITLTECVSTLLGTVEEMCDGQILTARYITVINKLYGSIEDADFKGPLTYENSWLKEQEEFPQIFYYRNMGGNDWTDSESESFRCDYEFEQSENETLLTESGFRENQEIKNSFENGIQQLSENEILNEKKEVKHIVNVAQHSEKKVQLSGNLNQENHIENEIQCEKETLHIENEAGKEINQIEISENVENGKCDGEPFSATSSDSEYDYKSPESRKFGPSIDKDSPSYGQYHEEVEREQSHARFFCSKLQKFLVGLLQVRSTIEVDQAILDFSSKFCQDIYDASNSTRVIKDTANLSRNVEDALSTGAVVVENALGPTENLKNASNPPGIDIDAPLFPAEGRKSAFNPTGKSSGVIINGDGIYLLIYTTLNLNLKLIRNGFYTGGQNCPVGEAHFISLVLDSGMLVYISRFWISEVYFWVLKDSFLQRAGYDINTTNNSALINILTDFDGLGSCQQGSQLLSDFIRLTKTCHKIKMTPSEEAGRKLTRRIVTCCWETCLSVLSNALERVQENGSPNFNFLSYESLKKGEAKSRQDSFTLCLHSLQSMARLSNVLGIQNRCGGVFSLLALACVPRDEANKLTNLLGRKKKLHTAHILSFHSIVSLGLEIGSHAAECWKHLFRCCLHIWELNREVFIDLNSQHVTLTRKFHAKKPEMKINQNYDEDEVFFEEYCENRETITPCNFDSTNFVEDLTKCIEESSHGFLSTEASARALCALTAMIDRFFDDVACQLNLNALTSFLRELCSESHRQLFEHNKQSKKTEISTESLLLNRLNDVVLKALKCGRPQVHAMKMWAVVAPHFMKAACHSDPIVSKLSISGIHSIITWLLNSQVELPYFHCNEALFKPFQNIICLELCALDVQDQIVNSICEFVESCNSEIKSGWRPLFGALRCVRPFISYHNTSHRSVESVSSTEPSLSESSGHLRAIRDVYDSFLITNNAQVFANAATDCIFSLINHVKAQGESNTEGERVLCVSEIVSGDFCLDALNFLRRCAIILTHMFKMAKCPGFTITQRLNFVSNSVDFHIFDVNEAKLWSLIEKNLNFQQEVDYSCLWPKAYDSYKVRDHGKNVLSQQNTQLYENPPSESKKCNMHYKTVIPVIEKLSKKDASEIEKLSKKDASETKNLSENNVSKTKKLSEKDVFETKKLHKNYFSETKKDVPDTKKLSQKDVSETKKLSEKDDSETKKLPKKDIHDAEKEIYKLVEKNDALQIWFSLIEGLVGASTLCPRRYQSQVFDTIFSILKSTAACPGEKHGLHCLNSMLITQLQNILRKSSSASESSLKSSSVNEVSCKSFKQYVGMTTDLIVHYLKNLHEKDEATSIMLEYTLKQFCHVLVECVAHWSESVATLGASCIRHIILRCFWKLDENLQNILICSIHRASQVSLFALHELMEYFHVSSMKFYGDFGQVKVAARSNCTGRDSERLRQLSYQVFQPEHKKLKTETLVSNLDFEDRSFSFLLYPREDNSFESRTASRSNGIEFSTLNSSKVFSSPIGVLKNPAGMDPFSNLSCDNSSPPGQNFDAVLSSELVEKSENLYKNSAKSGNVNEKSGSVDEKSGNTSEIKPRRIPLQSLIVGLISCQMILQTTALVLLQSNVLARRFSNSIFFQSSVFCQLRNLKINKSDVKKLSISQIRIFLNSLKIVRETVIQFDSRPGLKFLVQKVARVENAANLYRIYRTTFSVSFITLLDLILNKEYFDFENVKSVISWCVYLKNDVKETRNCSDNKDESEIFEESCDCSQKIKYTAAQRSRGENGFGDLRFFVNLLNELLIDLNNTFVDTTKIVYYENLNDKIFRDKFSKNSEISETNFENIESWTKFLASKNKELTDFFENQFSDMFCKLESFKDSGEDSENFGDDEKSDDEFAKNFKNYLKISKSSRHAKQGTKKSKNLQNGLKNSDSYSFTDLANSLTYLDEEPRSLTPAETSEFDFISVRSANTVNESVAEVVQNGGVCEIIQNDDSVFEKTDDSALEVVEKDNVSQIIQVVSEFIQNDNVSENTGKNICVSIFETAEENFCDSTQSHDRKKDVHNDIILEIAEKDVHIASKSDFVEKNGHIASVSESVEKDGHITTVTDSVEKGGHIASVSDSVVKSGHIATVSESVETDVRANSVLEKPSNIRIDSSSESEEKYVQNTNISESPETNVYNDSISECAEKTVLNSSVLECAEKDDQNSCVSENVQMDEFIVEKNTLDFQNDAEQTCYHKNSELVQNDNVSRDTENDTEQMSEKNIERFESVQKDTCEKHVNLCENDSRINSFNDDDSKNYNSLDEKVSKNTVKESDSKNSLDEKVPKNSVKESYSKNSLDENDSRNSSVDDVLKDFRRNKIKHVLPNSKVSKTEAKDGYLQAKISLLPGDNRLPDFESKVKNLKTFSEIESIAKDIKDEKANPFSHENHGIKQKQPKFPPEIECERDSSIRKDWKIRMEMLNEIMVDILDIIYQLNREEFSTILPLFSKTIEIGVFYSRSEKLRTCLDRLFSKILDCNAV